MIVWIDHLVQHFNFIDKQGKSQRGERDLTKSMQLVSDKVGLDARAPIPTLPVLLSCCIDLKLYRNYHGKGNTYINLVIANIYDTYSPTGVDDNAFLISHVKATSFTSSYSWWTTCLDEPRGI